MTFYSSDDLKAAFNKYDAALKKLLQAEEDQRHGLANDAYVAHYRGEVEAAQRHFDHVKANLYPGSGD